MNLLYLGLLFTLLAASVRSTSNSNPITINPSTDSSNVQSPDIPDVFDPQTPVDYFPGKPEGFILGNDSTASEEDEYSKRAISITNHGGALMTGTVRTYVIFYGNWVDSVTNQQVRSILINFLSVIGSSQWFQITANYISNAGVNTSFASDIGYGASTYTYGSVLKNQNIYNIVQDSISSNRLPTDENGLYYVITSPDVQQYDDPTYGFCTNSGGKVGYCGWHSYGNINGKVIKFSFIGNPSNCNTCDSQRTSPNGNWQADSMTSIIAHELAEAITDPVFTGWYDANGEENADKCAWQYGSTASANGYQYNAQFGGRKWLLQQLWKVSGGCALTP